MDWITPALICLWCLLTEFTLKVEGVEAEEKTAVTLECPAGNVEFISRAWYRGNVTEITHKNRLFYQIDSEVISRLNARADMSVDRTTFSLTIGSVQLEDDSYFTCQVYDKKTLKRTHYPVQLSVYIQPKITFTGLEKTSYTENSTVTVSCVIDRAYPALGGTQFEMLWGTQGLLPTSHTNNDSSYKYTIEATRKLTREDNGKDVSCRVTPSLGNPVTVSKTLDVLYISADPASISVNPENPHKGDQVVFKCNKNSIKANPEPRLFKLYKDGELIKEWSESPSYTLTVNTNDTGIYKCSLGNGVGFSSQSYGVQVNVSATPNPGAVSGQSIVPAAAGGAVAGVILIIIIIGIVVYCRRAKANKNGTSTDALNKPSTLDRRVVPPEDFGDAQYSDLAPPVTKPIPAQRSFRKKPQAAPRKPEPIYDVANVNSTQNAGVYSNVNGDARDPEQGIEPQYAEVVKPPKKPPRVNEVDNNNANKKDSEGLVYAELSLDKGRSNDGGIMPRTEEPTEYARIDFVKSGRR